MAENDQEERVRQKPTQSRHFKNHEQEEEKACLAQKLESVHNLIENDQNLIDKKRRLLDPEPEPEDKNQQFTIQKRRQLPQQSAAKLLS